MLGALEMRRSPPFNRFKGVREGERPSTTENCVVYKPITPLNIIRRETAVIRRELTRTTLTHRPWVPSCMGWVFSFTNHTPRQGCGDRPEYMAAP